MGSLTKNWRNYTGRRLGILKRNSKNNPLRTTFSNKLSMTLLYWTNAVSTNKPRKQAVKIRADIEVACYGYEGIGAVKTALKAGIACSTEEIPIKINLIAPPLYVMTTQTPERQDGLKALEIAIEKVQESIVQLGGVFQIQMAPKVVTAMDEAKLARQMEKAELENAEIGGDDDQSYMEAAGNEDAGSGEEGGEEVEAEEE